ncbi:lysophospholipid acyltransferase family protein [Gordonia sp. LSe1-13]|uniref:Lysophospholipid acyltransferase family protein n=1 Tax=Gordonia sesuvii TaxID=3116777 RepID=A0ABU7MGV2_9ACTN|nr:lysophospholipid acyltransferase family protein [Gordonia sp. LSe1-13]
MEPVYRTLEVIAHGLVRAQGLDLRFSGLDNIPRAGGAVLAVNHTSYVDFLPVALGLYRAGRRTRFMIKSEVMDIAIMRFLVNHTKTVPVNRSAGSDAYRLAVEELRDGEIVAVYPESTISRSFELKEFKTGAARMAGESGVPIVPAIVWGAQRQWTKTDTGNRQMGRSRLPVAVSYGAPLHVGADEEPQSATARLHEEMTTLLHHVQDEYGPHPHGEFWVPARLGGSAPTPEQARGIEDAEAAAKAAAREQRAKGGQ